MKRIHVLLTAAALIVVATPALAQAPQASTSDRTITVTGEGYVDVTPDIALLRAGVTTEGKTAAEATHANNAAMTKVLAALKQAGIAERDIGTTQFSINPVHENQPGHASRITGFRVTNQVSVKIRDVHRVGTVLDAAVAAGANDIYGVQFTVSQRSQRLDQARTEAVKDAQRKAELLAKAGGARLGPVTLIREGGASPRPYAPTALRAAAASVPIAVGQQTLSVSVTVTFALLP